MKTESSSSNSRSHLNHLRVSCNFLPMWIVGYVFQFCTVLCNVHFCVMRVYAVFDLISVTDNSHFLWVAGSYGQTWKRVTVSVGTMLSVVFRLTSCSVRAMKRTLLALTANCLTVPSRGRWLCPSSSSLKCSMHSTGAPHYAAMQGHTDNTSYLQFSSKTS